MKPKPLQIHNHTHLGDLIKDAREKQGLSHYKVAKDSGITQGQLADLENGKYNSGVDMYISVIEALGLKMLVG